MTATATEPANHAHAVFDFGPHDQKAQKSIARKLKAFAVKRGRQHP